MAKNVKDVEVQMEAKFSEVLKDLGILPPGYTPSVTTYGEKNRKKRNATFHWSPETDRIEIRFEQTASGSHSQELNPATSPQATVSSTQPTYESRSSSALEDLIRALYDAESRRGYEFVALKWFRDTVLPAEGFTWAVSDAARQNILREAIDKRLVLTSKVPNPKSPQFPVTAIRLNRLMPEVGAVLGTKSNRMDDFCPVPIRGEELSATILRDRR